MKTNEIVIIGHSFEIQKDGSLWYMIEPKSRQKVSTNGMKTKKDCIKSCEKIINVVGKIGLIKAINRHKRKLILKSEPIKTKFQKIFKQPLWTFYNPLFEGFDIIKFDQFLKTPDGISTKDYITKKYGKKASNFIRALNKL